MNVKGKPSPISLIHLYPLSIKMRISQCVSDINSRQCFVIMVFPYKKRYITTMNHLFRFLLKPYKLIANDNN